MSIYEALEQVEKLMEELELLDENKSLSLEAKYMIAAKIHENALLDEQNKIITRKTVMTTF
jgi:hypothetical protein